MQPITVMRGRCEVSVVFSNIAGGSHTQHRQHTFEFFYFSSDFHNLNTAFEIKFLLLNCETETLETYCNLIYFEFDSWTAQFLIPT